MANEAWTCNLPAACQTLLESEQICQEYMQEKLKEIDAEFVWVNEIVDEAYKLFSVKSSKLMHMPKTPCMKQKVHIYRNVEPDISAPPKVVPKQLKFGSLTETVRSSTTVNGCNQSIRNCHRISKVVCAKNDKLAKKTTQQSRNSFSENKSSEFKSMSENGLSVQDDCNENKLPEIEILNKELVRRGGSESNDVVRERTCGRNVLNKDVRECATSREAVLKCAASKSQSRLANASTRGPVASKLDTSRKEGWAAKVSCNLKSSSDTSHNVQLSDICSSKSLQQNAKLTSKFSSEAKNTKQVSTRLRLKEHTQHKQDAKKCEIQKKTNNESSNLDKSSQLSEFYQQNKELCKNSNEKDNFGMLETIRSAQSPSNALDETVTVITEVFEIDKGQPVRLKEFEIIKTKTTPASETIEPHIDLIFTDSGYHHPYSTSDHGFNDDGEESINTGSDESLVRVKRSAGKGVDDGCITDEKIDMLTRTRTQQNNEVTIKTTMAAKSDKDSGIALETVKPATATDTTFTKDGKSSKDDIRAAHTRTRAQKESSAEEITGRSTRTRQNKVTDLSQSRSTTTENQQIVIQAPFRNTTCSKLSKANSNKPCFDRSDNKTTTRSPVVTCTKSPFRNTKEHLAAEKDLSPGLIRSCNDDHNSRSPKPFRFNSNQNQNTVSESNKNTGFEQNANTFSSFLMSPPRCNTSGIIASFLKRNTPPPQHNAQIYQERKRQVLIDKENRDMERLRKAAEFRQQKLTVQRQLREEKEQRVAGTREIRLHHELELKEIMNKRLEAKAELKENLLQEKFKEEREKQKQRLQKQMVTEERIKKLFDQEEETKTQGEFKRKNKELEEADRKRQITEERKKREEQLAECEQKRKEEKLRLKQAEEEKERERERLRIEKEKQIACERTVRERIEREKREEKDRLIREDHEKLKTMERERLRREQERIQQQQTSQQAIKKHSNSPSKKLLDASSRNNMQTLCSSSNSKITREKQIAFDRTEHERIERQKREEKDRLIREEHEKLKAMERVRLQREQERIQQQQMSQQTIKKNSNSPSKKPLAPNTINTTQTLCSSSSSKITSYQMTPVRKNIVSTHSSNLDNYNIEDKDSDESTDDDEAPKKIIPEWAKGIPLKTALIRQHVNSPDIEKIFRTNKIETPDLILLFPGRRRLRYNHRTSSAIWNSPPLLQH